MTNDNKEDPKVAQFPRRPKKPGKSRVEVAFEEAREAGIADVVMFCIREDGSAYLVSTLDTLANTVYALESAKQGCFR